VLAARRPDRASGKREHTEDKHAPIRAVRRVTIATTLLRPFDCAKRGSADRAPSTGECAPARPEHEGRGYAKEDGTPTTLGRGYRPRPLAARRPPTPRSPPRPAATQRRQRAQHLKRERYRAQLSAHERCSSRAISPRARRQTADDRVGATCRNGTPVESGPPRRSCK
jgi:hypothetical protein